MRLTQLAVTSPERFAEFVAELRKLGVVKLGALVLGPKPPEVRTEAERQHEADPVTLARRAAEAAERRHATMFAASSMRPPLPVSPPDPGAAPRAVVQRREGAARTPRGKHARS